MSRKEIRFGEAINFTGQVKCGEHAAPVSFSAAIEKSGAVTVSFEDIEVTAAHNFIVLGWMGDGYSTEEYELHGISEDGVTFETKEMSFSSLGSRFVVGASRVISPVTDIRYAIFRFKTSEPTPLPSVQTMLKGFESMRVLESKCELGAVAISGGIRDRKQPSLDDEMTGKIAVIANEIPIDLAAWRERVDQLHEHLRRVMSVAASVVLSNPVSIYSVGEDIEIHAYAQASQSLSVMPAVHRMQRQALFEAAVKSFFNPPIQVNNLYFAIEWFAMNARYDEVRLTNAMTALENLIDSNLSKKDALILPPKLFTKVKDDLRAALRTSLEKHAGVSGMQLMDMVDEMDKKFLDLNRKTLLVKLKILCDQWNVPREGIDPTELQAAKSARDKVVHVGRFVSHKEHELWHYVTLVRELLLRIFFTAIGYAGDYISHYGGLHHAQFSLNPAASAEVPNSKSQTDGS